MDDAKLKLTKSPIIEAILDIECSQPAGRELAALKNAAYAAFSDRYPKFQEQLLKEHKVTSKEGAQPQLSVTQKLEALQFLHDDRKQLVQVRAKGFSYNRLFPYTTLDDYLPEIERCWKLYLELASPEQVRNVRLRYINRILLPFTEGRVELDNYLKIGPHLPDEETLTLTGFVNQHAAVDVETGNQVHILLTSLPPEGATLPVIFDNSATAPGPGDPKDWTWIISKIMSLREIMDRIFQKSLSESCLNLFR